MLLIHLELQFLLKPIIGVMDKSKYTGIESLINSHTKYT